MIRIGIVGCGRILAAHLRGYRLLREAGVDDFRITALCARKLDDARMYVKRGEGPAQRPAVSDIPGDPLAIGDVYLSDFQDDVAVQIFDDYRRMIADGPIDAVNDFTPHGLHHLVADAAVRNGKELLTQKPLSVTVKSAKHMCEAFERAELVLGVFENARYRDQTRYARWLFDSGKLGDVQMALFGNVGTWWAPNRIVANTPWRHKKNQAGGIALDLGVHQFNMMRCIAGEIDTVQGATAVIEPQRVRLDAEGVEVERIDCDADDTFHASFTTKTGAFGTLFSSWAGHGEPTVIQPGPVFYGSRGRLAGTQVTFDDGSVHDAATLYANECAAPRKQRDFPLGLTDDFALAQYDWLAAIRERRAPETSGREGLIDLACAYAVLESATAGRRATVAEVLSGELDAYQQQIALSPNPTT